MQGLPAGSLRAACLQADWSVSLCTAQIVLAACSFTRQAYVLQAWAHRSTQEACPPEHRDCRARLLELCRLLSAEPATA